MTDEESWEKRLRAKLDCVKHDQASFYLYHQRKAAGTTVREILRQSAISLSAPFFETEGISMYKEFSSRYIHASSKIDDSMSLISVTSLRNPVDRIVSLYWYEHVAWFDEVLHQPLKMKPFHVWVDGWRDGNTFKEGYTKRSPGSVYVEIQNCYIKSLIGWRGGVIDYRTALPQAKAVIEGFDILVLSEWMSDPEQKKYLSSLLGDKAVPGSETKLVSSDKTARLRLHSQLMLREAETMAILYELNKYDLELYEYAQKLLRNRIEHVNNKPKPYHTPLLFLRGDVGISNDVCMDDPPAFTKPVYNFRARNPKLEQGNLVGDNALPAEFRRQIGLFQHPGHKGPF